jgi:hypothetical protein
MDNKIIKISNYINSNLIELEETVYDIKIELDISIRLWHSIQETFIRKELEPLLLEIEVLKNILLLIKEDD